MVRVRRKNMQGLRLIAIFLFLMVSCARPPEPPVIEEPEIVEDCIGGGLIRVGHLKQGRVGRVP